jgi:hypothetical protein
MFNKFLSEITNKPGIFVDYNNSNIANLIDPNRLIVFNLNPKTDLTNWQNTNIKTLLDDMKIIIISINIENIDPEEVRNFFANSIYNKINCFIDDSISFYFNGNCKNNLDYQIDNCNIKFV